MNNRHTLLLASFAFAVILVSLLVLALPDTVEGEIIYTIDATHTVRVLDLVGVALLALGGLAAWVAGILWKRNVTTT